MPRFPYLLLFFLFAPCLFGTGIGIYGLFLTSFRVDVWIFTTVFGLVTSFLGIIGLIWFHSQWWKPYLLFSKALHKASVGSSLSSTKKIKSKVWLPLVEDIREIERNFDEVINFSASLAQQKFEAELGEDMQNTPFAKRLYEVRRQLHLKQQEDEKRSWAMRGMAEFSDILRNSEHLELETLSVFFLSHLVKYMKARQGVIYLLNEKNPQDLHLELVANYAISKVDFDNKRVEIDEGVTGEAFKRRKYYYIEDIKNDYSPIFSGLGAGSPRSLLIFPISLSDKVIGVLEMASWQMYEIYHLDFLETICNNFAVAVENFYMQAQTEALMKEAERQS